MLAIGRALMTEPKLLLLDEPSLGLAPFLVDEIVDIIKRINREAKTAVLLVEQNAAVALDVVEHAYLMDSGRVVMSGPAEACGPDPDVGGVYPGGQAGRLPQRQVLSPSQAVAGVASSAPARRRLVQSPAGTAATDDAGVAVPRGRKYGAIVAANRDYHPMTQKSATRAGQ